MNLSFGEPSQDESHRHFKTTTEQPVFDRNQFNSQALSTGMGRGSDLSNQKKPIIQIKPKQDPKKNSSSNVPQLFNQETRSRGARIPSEKNSNRKIASNEKPKYDDRSAQDDDQFSFGENPESAHHFEAERLDDSFEGPARHFFQANNRNDPFAEVFGGKKNIMDRDQQRGSKNPFEEEHDMTSHKHINKTAHSDISTPTRLTHSGHSRDGPSSRSRERLAASKIFGTNTDAKRTDFLSNSKPPLGFTFTFTDSGFLNSN